MLPSNQISTFPLLIVLNDTIFKQQQKYKIGSYLEPDLSEIQQQPLQVFWKKRCSQKFCKIHRKIPVPEIFFLSFFKDQSFMEKESPAQMFSCECCEISRTTFFAEHLRANASGNRIITYNSVLFRTLFYIKLLRVYHRALLQIQCSKI